MKVTVQKQMMLLLLVAYSVSDTESHALANGDASQPWMDDVGKLRDQLNAVHLQVGALQAVVEELKADRRNSAQAMMREKALVARVAELENDLAMRRRLQRTGGPATENVRQITVATESLNCPLRTGRPDWNRCNDPAFERCNHDACAQHHRRTQEGSTSCPLPKMSSRVEAVELECCDEPGEDCSEGQPRSCNQDCAAVFLDFFADCESALGPDSAEYAPTVALCQAELDTSLAIQLGVQCADGTAPDDCVPRCCAELHGFQLLLNIDGEDNKMTCELHDNTYSWVGPAVRCQAD